MGSSKREMVSEHAVYGVWLQLVMGEGSRKVPLLLDYFGSCRAVYEADEIERRLSGLLVPGEIKKMEETPLDQASEIVDACVRLHYQILTPDDAAYPGRLRNIADYPAALYISGEWPAIDDEVCIAMVGTRRASRYGYDTAMNIARDLAACGAIVVSGCARGIDTAAHQGALIGGGKTMGVLGCGINTPYNMQNEGLRQVISASGAIISEFPPGAPPLNYHFPIRNRLISALTLGVVVVEAGDRSGSLITANLALEQGRDVFAVPGQVSSPMAKGVNKLIFDGAKPIEDAYGVLEDYVVQFPHKIHLEYFGRNVRVYDRGVRPKWEREPVEKQKKPPASVRSIPSDQAVKPRLTEMEAAADRMPEPENNAPVGMSENAVKVMRVLSGTPKPPEDIAAESGVPAAELMKCLTELELYGKVRILPGKRYTGIK
ncbi:MAG: DNA-processing protein DprA [Clostridia bacterium]|nr:DNA-processing protein DprA [Clostridia bacterium]MBQ4397940.1 DNA-processing protein DprA [Clostridia bacterium]